MEGVELILSIVTGVIAIIGAVYAFNKWIMDWLGNRRPSGLFIKEGNINLVYSSGVTKQVTFVNSDSSAVLSHTKVVFFREERINLERPYSRYKLMSLDTKTLKETIVSDQKPFADGLDGSFEILSPRHLSVSQDQSKAVFVVEKYATGSEMVNVDLKTGKWTELFSVERFEIISSGKFKNQLLVGISEVGNKGRDIHYKVCNHDGVKLLEFKDREEYMAFRSTAMIKVK